MGLYCNNHPLKKPGWINQLSACPLIEDKTTIKNPYPDELNWMKRKK